MNKDELEQLMDRFGEDMSAWPSPYRQEAAALSKRADRDVAVDDEALDRLILEAALEPTDERVLTRDVLARVGQTPQRTFALSAPMWSCSWPAAVASAALVVAVAAASGYMVAGSGGELSDDVLLAFATGEPPGRLVELMGMNRANGG
jgi:hypothetical protein